MPIKIAADRVVKLAYRLTDTEGRLIEERTPEEPYEYLQGRGQILFALERALAGKTPGFRTEIQFSPREAYGEYDSTLVAQMPLDRFPKGVSVTVGMKFDTTGPAGNRMTVRVIEIDEVNATIDGNHPLAGLELIFDVRVLDVREATEEEIESGEVLSADATDSEGGQRSPRPGFGEGSGRDPRSLH